MRLSTRSLVVGLLLLVLPFAASCASAQDAPESATPVREVISGGATIRGGGIRMDVQVGRAFSQPPIKSATVTAKPITTVTP